MRIALEESEMKKRTRQQQNKLTETITMNDSSIEIKLSCLLINIQWVGGFYQNIRMEGGELHFSFFEYLYGNSRSHWKYIIH